MEVLINYSFVQEINDHQFTQILTKKEDKYIVAFISVWSSESMLLINYLERMSQSNEDVSFHIINKEQHQEYFKQFRLNKVPTSLLIYKGEVLKYIEGCPSYSKLDKTINEVFSQ